MSIQENLEEVRSQIAEAEKESGREAGSVSLVAVSKTWPVEVIEEAVAAGADRCVNCGLCTYVCPSKIELREAIAQGLDRVRAELGGAMDVPMGEPETPIAGEGSP